MQKPDRDFLFLRPTFDMCRETPLCGEITFDDYDVRNVLGVTPVIPEADSSEAEVLITFPYKIYKYKFVKFSVEKSDEWSVKSRLTSSVVYDDYLKHYVGVFNDDIVRIWYTEEHNVDDVPKYKFQQPISRLLVRRDKPTLILFANGSCVSLEHGIEHCKTLRPRGLLKKSAEIIDVICYTRHQTDYVCYTMKEGEAYSIVIYPLLQDSCECDHTKVNVIKVTRDDKKTEFSMVGTVILGTDSPVVNFVWQDKYNATYDVVKQTWQYSKQRYRNWLNYKEKMAMVCVDKKHVLTCGKTFDQPAKSVYFIPYFGTDGDFSVHLIDHYSKYTKVYSHNNFIMVADLKKITVKYVYRIGEFVPELACQRAEVARFDKRRKRYMEKKI